MLIALHPHPLNRLRRNIHQCRYVNRATNEKTWKMSVLLEGDFCTEGREMIVSVERRLVPLTPLSIDARSIMAGPGPDVNTRFSRYLGAMVVPRALHLVAPNKPFGARPIEYIAGPGAEELSKSPFSFSLPTERERAIRLQAANLLISLPAMPNR